MVYDPTIEEPIANTILIFDSTWLLIIYRNFQELMGYVCRSVINFWDDLEGSLLLEPKVRSIFVRVNPWVLTTYNNLEDLAHI